MDTNCEKLASWFVVKNLVGKDFYEPVWWISWSRDLGSQVSCLLLIDNEDHHLLSIQCLQGGRRAPFEGHWDALSAVQQEAVWDHAPPQVGCACLQLGEERVSPWRECSTFDTGELLHGEGSEDLVRVFPWAWEWRGGGRLEGAGT